MSLIFAVVRRRLALIAFLMVLVAAGTGVFWWHGKSESALAAAAVYQTPQEADLYVRFDMEAYDLISTNYWAKPGMYSNFGVPELSDLFRLAADREMGGTFTLASSTRAGVAGLLGTVLSTATSTALKEQHALGLLNLVIQSLPPQGRSRVLSTQDQTAIRNFVDNVNPSADPYGDLGVAKGANQNEVDTAFTKKQQELAATTSPAGEAELAKVQHAHDVLSAGVNKTIYDQTGAQPTLTTRRDGHTLYIGIAQVAPTTIQEVGAAIEAASSTPGLNSLIIDLRGNPGGALDFPEYFMSLFLGPQQYAFDLFHQGELQVARTQTIAKLPELDRFREIAVLIDGKTQSTAELTASILRHDRFAHIVGTKSAGWGSAENTYPLSTRIDPNQRYALLLVTQLTVRDDGAPIEGNGVVPDVDVSQPGWKDKLSHFFTSSDLISAIQKEIATAVAQ